VLPEDGDGVLDLILILTPKTQPSHTFFRSLGFADVCGPQDHIPIVSELCHMPPETQVKLIFDTLKNEVLCFQALAAADFV
jgi:hypothetical protein